MYRIDGHMKKERCRFAGYALLILPAVALGVLAMLLGGVSPALWGQQAAAWAIFALLAWPLRPAAKRIGAAVWGTLLLLLLTATLLGEEIGGTRRWIDLIVFHANAAMLLLPALLCTLCRMKHPLPLLLSVAFVLTLQPDLSQLTAFCAAVLPVLYLSKARRTWRLCTLLLLGALIVICSSRPVLIDPVSYCEGILTMLMDLSPLLHAVGWAALAVIPAFFLIQFSRQRKPEQLSMSIYYAIIMAFILSGKSPVPFMGFGLSPIAGYYLASLCSTEGSQES